MKKISMLVFGLAIATGSFAHAFAPRDAGSKIRGDAYYGSSEARTRGYSQPAPVPQQQYVRTAPQAPANATAAAGQTTGTRTMSVEPQTPARTQTQTYRTYAPQRRGLLGWIFGN